MFSAKNAFLAVSCLFVLAASASAKCTWPMLNVFIDCIANEHSPQALWATGAVTYKQQCKEKSYEDIKGCKDKISGNCTDYKNLATDLVDTDKVVKMWEEMCKNETAFAANKNCYEDKKRLDAMRNCGQKAIKQLPDMTKDLQPYEEVVLMYCKFYDTANDCMLKAVADCNDTAIDYVKDSLEAFNPPGCGNGIPALCGSLVVLLVALFSSKFI